MSMPTLSNEPVNNNQWLDEILNEVAKGARLDGFHSRDLLAYPNQSDRYMKPAKSAILSKLETIEQEAKVDVWQEVDNLALGYRSYRMSDVAQERLRQLKGKG